MSGKAEEVKRWYDGFIFGTHKDIYNPWSIINYLDKKEVAPYWANTSSNELVRLYIENATLKMKEEFEKVINNQHELSKEWLEIF